MAEIDVVSYRKHECHFSMDRDEGLRIFREFYSESWLGVVTKNSQLVAFIPALSSEEFKCAHYVADKLIDHMRDVTSNTLKKIKP
mgnify:CR=1 FL=1